MTSAWSYDAIADLYDEDMAPRAPPGDVAFYAAIGARQGGPALELGCGTGRIAIELARSGVPTIGVDRSAAMLRVAATRRAALAPGERARLALVCGDLRRCPVETSFALVVCAFSVLTYLETDDEQAMVLRWIRDHLAEGGLVACDLFAPRSDIQALPDDHVFLDYDRPRADGTRLVRTKTIRRVASRVNVIERTYRCVDVSGAELWSRRTVDRVRWSTPGEVRAAFTRAGLRMVQEGGGFHGEPLDSAAHVMLFVAGR